MYHKTNKIFISHLDTKIRCNKMLNESIRNNLKNIAIIEMECIWLYRAVLCSQKWSKALKAVEYETGSPDVGACK